jgi:uncharacterized delta-60 repeat protein
MPRATLVIQPDGRILIATSSSDSQPFLARYLPTGAPDTSFGVGGKRTFSFSGGRDPAKGLALTSDGHIVLEAAQGQLLYAARYSANGVLDGTFGGSSTGWIALTIPASASPGYGIALQSDNSVLIPVSWPDGGMDSSDQAVIRLTPSGALDSGFGVSGLSQTVGWVGQNESSRALTIDSAGRIILAGSHFDGTAGWIMVAAIRSQ